MPARPSTPPASLPTPLVSPVDTPVVPPPTLPGYIGSLTINIPWKQLFPSPKKPVEAHIDEIFIVLGPNLDQPYNKETDEKLKAAAKASAIAAWQEALASKKTSDADAKKKASFTEKLIASIINNIQVCSRPWLFSLRWCRRVVGGFSVRCKPAVASAVTCPASPTHACFSPDPLGDGGQHPHPLRG